MRIHMHTLCPLLWTNTAASTTLCYFSIRTRHNFHAAWTLDRNSKVITNDSQWRFWELWATLDRVLERRRNDTTIIVYTSNQILCAWILCHLLSWGYVIFCNPRDHMILIHYSDIIMSAMATQVTSGSTICPTVYSGTDHRKSSASLAFVRGIHSQRGQ